MLCAATGAWGFLLAVFDFFLGGFEHHCRCLEVLVAFVSADCDTTAATARS